MRPPRLGQVKHTVRLHTNSRVYPGDMRRKHLHLRLAQRALHRTQLAVQVGRAEHIRVKQAQSPHTGARQRLGRA